MMQLNPRYGDDPLVELHFPPSAVAAPAIRQRRRLAELLATFTEGQWAHPSRCAGWTNRDVIVHLDSTNAFWAFSIGAALGGEPTRFLATFDPVASPAELVAAAAGTSSAEVLERFVASNEAFLRQVEALSEAQWSVLAEAPPGHVGISSLVHHALWDSWVHERDILLPLGEAPDLEEDEVAACLRYGVALGPAFALSRDADRTGTVALDVTGPEVRVVAVVDARVAVRPADEHDLATADLRVEGDAVEVLEALSVRRPLDAEVPAGAEWLATGLAETFDVTPA